MFDVLHKVDMYACYAKQKINLAYPNSWKVIQVNETQTLPPILNYIWLGSDCNWVNCGY